MAISLSKIVTPGDGRKSRLHDAQDNRISVSRLMRNGPRAIATAALIKVANRRPTQPWISYDAIRVLETILTPRSRVLEYGSGMSTVWYAAHSRQVVSVEDDSYWAEFNTRSFAERGIHNAEIVTATDRETYVSAGGRADPAGERFDFVVIDGRYRDACAERALEVVREGGWIYLDNSDVVQFNDLDGDVGRARKIIVDAAKAKGRAEQYFLDFSPACLHPTGGTLVQV